jgi:hypothetical protein
MAGFRIEANRRQPKEIIMRFSVIKSLCSLMLALGGIASRSDAGIITVPPGLSPGETYRLVFVTAHTTDTYSADIAYYNAFVTNEANTNLALAALAATWKVIGSTESVSAASNIGNSSGAIYNLAGLEVASSTAALFAVGTIPLLNPVLYDQSGDIQNNQPVWTGTCAPLGSTCGGDAFGDGYSAVGLSWSTTSTFLFTDYYPATDGRPVYAISSTLTVPLPPVPEPASIGLFALGGTFLVLLRRINNKTTIERGR